MNEINDLVEKIKNRWKGDTISYTEMDIMDMLRIIELLIKQIEELFEHVRTKDYYENLEDDLVRQIANNQKIMIEQLLKEKDKLQKDCMKISELEKQNANLRDELHLENAWHRTYKDEAKMLREENDRLREALKWHPISELPEIEIPGLWTKGVLLKNQFDDIKFAYFSLKSNCWYDYYITAKKIEINKNLMWCYIPEDKDGA